MADGSLDTVREALFEALLISLPILGAGLLIGLVISVLQAVTQIQEQTLTFVPKIVVMIVVSILLLGWIAVRLGDFSRDMFDFAWGPGDSGWPGPGDAATALACGVPLLARRVPAPERGDVR